MVKLTMVGRVSDGLPLAQGPRYTIEENNNFLFYKQQAEFILKEISKGALAHSKMTIHIDHHCFKQHYWEYQKAIHGYKNAGQPIKA
nr:25.3 kda vesicle transport protein [Quercus suber]